MIQIDVRNNFPDVQRKLRSLRDDIGQRAVAAALNKTADKAKTAMVRQITSEYVIKASDVRPRLNVRRASASNLQVVAVLEALPGSRRGRSLNVIHFMERSVTLAEARRRAKAGTLNQLRFQFRRGQGRKIIPGAFVVTHNRGTFVAQRVGKKRLPIKSVQVIDVPQMFNAKRINQKVVQVIEREFPIEFDRATRVFVERFNRA